MIYDFNSINLLSLLKATIMYANYDFGMMAIS